MTQLLLIPRAPPGLEPTQGRRVLQPLVSRATGEAAAASDSVSGEGSRATRRAPGRQRVAGVAWQVGFMAIPFGGV